MPLPDPHILAALIGMTVSRVWIPREPFQPSLHVEFGALSPRYLKVDGTEEAGGLCSLHCCGHWRIEGENGIHCSHDARREKIEQAIAVLVGLQAMAVEPLGRLGDFTLTFSNHHYLSVFTTHRQQRWQLRLPEEVQESLQN